MKKEKLAARKTGRNRDLYNQMYVKLKFRV